MSLLLSVQCSHLINTTDLFWLRQSVFYSRSPLLTFSTYLLRQTKFTRVDQIPDYNNHNILYIIYRPSVKIWTKYFKWKSFDTIFWVDETDKILRLNKRKKLLFCIQFYYITSDQANKHGITPILLTGFFVCL